MSGFHTVTPGAAFLPIAFQARTAAAPTQKQHAGSTIAEIAGQLKRAAEGIPPRGICGRCLHFSWQELRTSETGDRTTGCVA